MAQPHLKKWTIDEFFLWQERQGSRFELVDGFPHKLMKGARNVHNDIVINVLSELRNQLRTSGCNPFPGECSVETLPGQIRRPDIGVECGPRDPNAYIAKNPCLIAEVLSPSTRDFDTYGKLNEYKRIEPLKYILIIEPNSPEILVWSKDIGGEWSSAAFDNLNDVIDLPAIG